MVVMDQFEETYTACTDPGPERAAFIGAPHPRGCQTTRVVGPW